jgi:hypothetical protein
MAQLHLIFRMEGLKVSFSLEYATKEQALRHMKALGDIFAGQRNIGASFRVES